MQTVTIDILNTKVVRLLQDLELMQLIRLRKDKMKTTNLNIEISKYKGAMTKQPLSEIDKQLSELRNEWE
ncbi:MAG: hypothetical protein K9I70_01215 [Chitinophagaceae bacterium]|jgi:hypothetical protein|nr:hypothetical protein [Chitinophagaceae bacterium]